MESLEHSGGKNIEIRPKRGAGEEPMKLELSILPHGISAQREVKPSQKAQSLAKENKKSSKIPDVTIVCDSRVLGW